MPYFEGKKKKIPNLLKKTYLKTQEQYPTSSNSAGRNHIASSSLLILVPSKLMGSSKSPCPALLYHIRLSPVLCAWVQLARIYPQNKAHLILTGSPRSTLYFRQSTDQSVQPSTEKEAQEKKGKLKHGYFMYQFALSPSTEVGICSRGPCASSPRITINHDACFLQAAQNRSPFFAFQVHSNMNTSGYICMPLTQGVL